MLLRIQILLLLSCHVLANVEKTIFLGPPAIAVPVAHPSLDDLSLIPLSPLHLSARTRLNASFPTDDGPRGTEHWLLLDGLSVGTRYEVRICWLATVRIICASISNKTRSIDHQQQPTAFSLHTYTLSQVFDEPELLGSLSAYAYARQAEIDDLERQRLVARRAPQTSSSANPTAPRISVLFLRIFAAADYYTLDKDLMENVQPVLVDIILDPYLFNVFPKSLLPTAGYVLIVAIASWFASQYVWKLVLELATPANGDSTEQSRVADKKTS